MIDEFLTQLNLDPEQAQIESDQKLNYLLSLPNKSTSKLFLNHKQEVFKFICTILKQGCIDDEILDNLTKMLLIVLIDDQQNSEANSQALIDLLLEKQGHVLNILFREVHSFIKPIDSLLQFFHHLNADNMNIVISLFGTSFQQYYKRYEEYILNELRSTKFLGLSLLNGIIKCFGTSVSEHSLEQVFKPILDCIKVIHFKADDVTIDTSLEVAWGLIGIVDLLINSKNTMEDLKIGHPVDLYMSTAFMVMLMSPKSPFGNHQEEHKFIVRHQASLAFFLTSHFNRIYTIFPQPFLKALARHSMLSYSSMILASLIIIINQIFLSVTS
ncbi:hypothetical protein SAMD00019534_085190 [Acytostelium subglobosum LB1]|uniref:hypothetical protein n=1 Tax=Acytostelium subglobosum LB1 TaxID=1410327 RepID=UPI000644FE9B|nr:hypothetical protein SAMD00019534_085190 [Acytostelium subglobosum LB1]GAM25344.1 hypothetical protein SAMD00019534_085190 [Acytostelium subglobosum LB1]|eukprot:XP_012751864.1 hypothetical protein SAMD00019534_085190 [Acytostelium subglobosum LB1]